MLSIFRSNHQLVGLLLIFYLLLLHAVVFFQPPPVPVVAEGIASRWLVPYMEGAAGYIWPAVFLLLLAIAANFMVYTHRMSAYVNMYAGVFIALVGSALPEFLRFHPLQPANVLLMLGLLPLMDVYRISRISVKLFNVGFWLGMAALFHAHYIWMLIPAIAGLVILRTGKLQEQLMIFTGFFVPQFLVGVYCFFFDQWDLYLTEQWREPWGWVSFATLSTLGFFRLLLLLVLVMVALLGYGANMRKTTIDVRKRIDVLYWVLLAAGLSVLSQGEINLAHLQLLVVPVGLLLSLAFARLSRAQAEAWHLVLLVAVLLLQFLPLLFPVLAG